MYYLKDIILGLRNEYLKNEELLNKLKEYIAYDSKKVSLKPKIYLNSIYAKVIIEIEQKQLFLQQLFNYLNKKDIIRVVSNLYSESYIENNKYNIQVKERFQNDFNNIINKIKKSESVYNIGFSKIAFQEGSYTKELIIKPDATEFTIRDQENYTNLQYNPADDEIIIKTNYPQETTYHDIKNILKIAIPKEEILLYNQKVIDSYLGKNRIYAYENTYKNKINLDIKQVDDAYYLIKKRSK